ncbi:MAG: SpoIIE family protein phosphatase [Clostridia bacterium]|nr:SpoIIE family protein phosphatase [Clostridia bacterium]
MKKFRNLVIGGIETKVLLLVVLCIVVCLGASSLYAIWQNQLLTEVTEQNIGKQEQSITENVSAVSVEVISQLLTRSNASETAMAEKMFSAAANHVDYVADLAAALLADPGSHSPAPYEGPDAAQDGTWMVKAVYAPETDPADPAVTERAGLFANLSDMILPLCQKYGAPHIYIGLKEGVFLTFSDTSSSWIVDGKQRVYDPRTRIWYTQAAEAGHTIFTEGEFDANTGSYCVECATPVYGPEGTLEAVVGTDIYLNDMLATMQSAVLEGESQILVGREGQIVLTTGGNGQNLGESIWGKNLEEMGEALLNQAADEARKEGSSSFRLGQMSGEGVYTEASRIPSTGWVLISLYNQKNAEQSKNLLLARCQEIQGETVELYQSQMKYLNRRVILLNVVTVLGLLVLAFLLGKRIVRPLNRIARRIADLGEENLEFKMEQEFHTGDEIQVLAESFADLSHKTVEYIDQVRTVTAEKERIGTELSMATTIQEGMLPHIVPAFPDRKDFDIIGSMDPAKEVGGDFYDYFLIDQDHLGIVIADVSGKGVPGALFMMASKIILQSVAMLGGSPAEVLTKANEAVCSNNEAEMFVTVWIGVLELSTGKLVAANAGHEYPTLRRGSGKFELYRDRHGFVIGGMPGVKYRQYELQLQPGDKLFIYTDGVPEATNSEQEMFGTDRMLQALNSDPSATPMELLQNVHRAVDDFVKDAEQFDDLTMVCMEYKGSRNE